MSTGDYVRMPMDSWPIPRKTGSQLFWAEPTDGSEMVRFFPVDGRLAREEGELKKFGFAPALGYFLEQGVVTYHLEHSPAEFVAFKRRLYERWGLKWDPEERLKQEEWELGVKIGALSRLAKAIEGVEVPRLELGMEMRDDAHRLHCHGEIEMRSLTRSQKKLLDEWLRKNPETGIGFIVQDLPDKIWDRIVEINDTEIIVQETECYVQDKVMGLEYKRPWDPLRK